MALLTVDRIGKNQSGTVLVHETSFNQEPGWKIGIAGETGSGKSTLLKMIAGLIQPDHGEVRFEGVRVKGPDEKLLPGHPAIAYLSQHYELRHHYKVHELLEYVNTLEPERANQLYEICQIKHLMGRRSDQLSGGEAQRIALARLLGSSPRLLLLDEPFSNLDNIHKKIIKSVIRDIGTQLGITCILVAHDALDLLSWADEIMVMKNGEIIQRGSAKEIYRQPVNEYCAGLFGEYNIIRQEDRVRFLRPEDLEIVQEGKHRLKGQATDVQFWGSYYMLIVTVSHLPIQVRTTHGNYPPGSDVFLNYPDENAWFI